MSDQTITAEVEPREGSEFTHYPEAGVSIEYRDASHRYWLHKDGQRTAAISVTSALKVLDKPALVAWAERMGIEGALRLERAGELEGVPPEQALSVVRQRDMGAEAKRDAGADRGSAIHDALRSYCSVGTVPMVGDFPDEVQGYVKSLCRWLLDAEPEPILVEQVVGSPRFGFAGRFDLLAKIDGKRTLLDLKTSNRVYAEHHLQMAGYEIALRECGDHSEHRVILQLGDDGMFAVRPTVAEDEDYLAVLDCHRAMMRVRGAINAAEKAEEVPA